jgi:hypothetical protein
VLKQTIDILMGANCATLLFAELFLYAYDADILQGLFHDKI